MMDFEQVQIYGKRISLLTPLGPNEDGRVLFEYNYFEDDIWESAGYDIKTNKLSTGKIGSRQFCAVICAAYLLYEFYTQEFGIAKRDGMIYHGYSYIGWLNYLFDAKYTNARIQDPYRIYNLLPEHRREEKLMPYTYDSDMACVSNVGIVKYIAATMPDYCQEEGELEKRLEAAAKEDLKRPPYPPVEKLSTTDFLGYKGFSDDDRAYFWKPNGDVHFSPGMKGWMEGLQAELLEIESELDGKMYSDNLLKLLVELLSDANQSFGMIYMFREAFYDLISHPEDSKRQAAVILLQRLVKRGKDELPSPNPDRWLAWHEKRFSPARQRIKRYLAVIGNLELRKEILEF